MAEKQIFKVFGPLVVDEQSGALLVKLGIDSVPSGFTGGVKTVESASTPEKLVASATPCRYVRIGARVSASGSGLNSKPCFIGDADNQTIPIAVANFEGLEIEIDDASKLYVKAGADGEGVWYAIFT